MNDRIQKLRDQSVNTQPYISLERARLLTEFYQTGEPARHSVPVGRALAFKHLMTHKTIYIGEGELIVGEKGERPAATPTYPEICTHTPEDLDVLHSREKISFTVSEDDRRVQAELIAPFWSGRSIRDRIFNAVDPEWVEVYEAGVFTEFMEQRAPGHTVAGKHVFQTGFLDLQQEIQDAIAQLDFFNDPQAYQKREELRAMSIFADAVVLFAKRHADKALAMANDEKDPKRKAELENIAEVCNYVPACAPRTLWEAIQHYWFVHLAVTTELNTWDSFCPGRADQNLFPFYQADLREGRLTEEQAEELLQAWWVKFNNQPAPPKVGVTAEESNTYTDFCNINLGGVREDGSHGVNDLTYILMDVIEEMRLLQPSTSVHVSKKSPDRFVKRALEIIRTGFGQPSVFNTDAIITELTYQGKDLIDARNGGASGCVETGAFGTEAYILTGYFNLTKVLEITLHNGVDPRTGKTIGVETGDPRSFETFDCLFEAFTQQLEHFIDIKVKGNVIIERLWATHLPSLALSLITKDCIKNGRDYHDGGARYNTSYIQGVGIGTITDSLSALKYHVYENRSLDMVELLNALEDNFSPPNNQLREKLMCETPRYGNDDDYADMIMQKVFEVFFKVVSGRPNTRNGVHRINMLPTTSHVYFGSVVGATPEGRKAGKPLSEGISPVQGADLKGPTAVLRSAGKMDHLRTGGTLLNQKFTPDLLANDADLAKVVHLIRTYFKMDGHHIQFNVVSADMLREAQKNPEEYRTLIVRVAGYSDYFVNLGLDLQEEIIARTEHSSF